MLRYEASMTGGNDYKEKLRFLIPANVVRASGVLQTPMPPHAVKLVSAYAHHEHMTPVASRFMCFSCDKRATCFVSNVAAWLNPVPADGPFCFDAAIAICEGGSACDLAAREEGAKIGAAIGLTGSKIRGDSDAETAALRAHISCAACRKAVPGLLMCGRCKNVRYCSPACQRAHWKEHKADCKAPTVTA